MFAALCEAGPLPVAAPATAEEYLAERRALLEGRLSEIAVKAAADLLDDVHGLTVPVAFRQALRPQR